MHRHFSATDIIQPPVSVELQTDEVGSFTCEAICTSFIHWFINGDPPRQNEVVNVTRKVLNAGHWITTLWIRGLHNDINISCEALNVTSNCVTSSAVTLHVIPGEIYKTSTIDQSLYDTILENGNLQSTQNCDDFDICNVYMVSEDPIIVG